MLHPLSDFACIQKSSHVGFPVEELAPDIGIGQPPLVAVALQRALGNPQSLADLRPIQSAVGRLGAVPHGGSLRLGGQSFQPLREHSSYALVHT